MLKGRLEGLGSYKNVFLRGTASPSSISAYAVCEYCFPELAAFEFVIDNRLNTRSRRSQDLGGGPNDLWTTLDCKELIEVIRL